MIKAVIFDLDGTLYDNSKLPFYVIIRNIFHLRSLYAERMCRHKISGRFYGTKGAAYDELFRRISAMTGKSVARVSRWYWGIYMPSQVKAIKKHMHPKPWVDEKLRSFKEKGIKLVCFSEYSFIKEKLTALGIDTGLFDLMIDAPTAGGCKPCRKAFMYVAAKIDTHPANILVLGDREDTDGAGAESCNMKFHLVPKKDTPTLDLSHIDKDLD